MGAEGAVSGEPRDIVLFGGPAHGTVVGAVVGEELHVPAAGDGGFGAFTYRPSGARDAHGREVWRSLVVMQERCTWQSVLDAARRLTP